MGLIYSNISTLVQLDCQLTLAIHRVAFLNSGLVGVDSSRAEFKHGSIQVQLFGSTKGSEVRVRLQYLTEPSLNSTLYWSWAKINQNNIFLICINQINIVLVDLNETFFGFPSMASQTLLKLELEDIKPLFEFKHEFAWAKLVLGSFELNWQTSLC